MIEHFKFSSVFWTHVIEHAVKVGVAGLVGIVGHYGIQYALRQFIQKIATHPSDKQDEDRKRETTLLHIFSTSSRIIWWGVVGLMILQEVGFKIGPLLAAAGVAGIALGFGGQYLIRDLISGFFIIIENQYRFGDAVTIDGTAGVVENMTMRLTTLRDLDGVVHHIPHGEIKKISNMSKDFSRVNINLLVPYHANLDHLIKIINTVGQEVAQDPQWKEYIQKPPAFLRVEDFAESGMLLKILGETKPLKQWDVAGELRKRLKQSFDREGVHLPYPQREIHMREDL